MDYLVEAGVEVASTSSATDLGYRALADLAAAAVELDYRVVGGHMVQLLTYVYPAERARLRVTADADAGVDRATAGGQLLHVGLLDRGYTPEAGNSYVKRESGGTLSVDILIPWGTPGVTNTVGGRGFDSAPGLSLAMNCLPLRVHVGVVLTDTTVLEFVVPVPDLEAALVLKALAWDHRHAEKDLHDVVTLLELVEQHQPAPPRWTLGSKLTGTRRDAAHALYRIVDKLDRGDCSVDSPARAAALIRHHVSRP